ncbi:MAG: SMC-Scp complex subunit ScpB [Minisyncoccia bacterium]
MSELSKKIEAILFYSGEPVSLTSLAKILDSKKERVLEAIKDLEDLLQNRGIKILEANDQYSLVTSPEYSGLIEQMIKEERERDLGRAGIESLTIIAYKGPVTRREIDYIRGVNSQYALRNLLLRGLVERKASANDERMLQYTITQDTLRFLGLSRITDLPEYEQSRNELEKVKLEETEISEEQENGE